MQRPAAGLSRRLGLRHHGRHPLAYEARDIVEQRDVIGIDEVILMQRRTEQTLRNVFIGIDRDDAGHGERRASVDRDDARMSMRRAQNLQMQQPLNRQIHRVAGFAGHDGVGERIGQAGAQRLAGHVRLDVARAV